MITLELTQDQIQIILYSLNLRTQAQLDAARNEPDYMKRQTINDDFIKTVDTHSAIIDQAAQQLANPQEKTE